MKAFGVGAASGALLTAPLIGILYLASELTGLPFIPFDLFDWVARITPGPIITFGIDLMIDVLRLFGASVADTAKTAEKMIAVAQFFGLGVVVTGLFFAIYSYRGLQPRLQAGLIAGALVGIPMLIISTYIGGSDVDASLVTLWTVGIFLAWGALIKTTYQRLIPQRSFIEPAEGEVAVVKGLDRRQFLIRFGAATATITVASSGIGNLLARAADREVQAELATAANVQAGDTIRSSLPNANDPLMAAPGTRLEYTPLKDHYTVSIRTSSTKVDGATWTLPIEGLVENPVNLTLDQIRDNYEPRSQFVTLSCISGRVGSDLISTTQWTGASIQDILADVKPTSEARYLHIKSADGFYETVDLDLIMSDERIMLAYDWDGMPLPMDHGFPLRIWLPDRYGMKQPRWITEISVTDEYKEGYWVQRGWSEVARVESTSVIDTVASNATYDSNGQPLVPIGGIAFAGARGVSKVEVRVNEGPWQEAMLRSPLSETTWVVWRYDWPFTEGSHEFEVRCLEGDGTPQIEEKRNNHPSGATGIHSKKARL